MAFVRYTGVQLVAYALDMGGFLLMLHAFDAHPLAANVFGKIVAGVFAFAAHRSFTFHRAAEAPARRQGLLYFALLALNVPLSSGVLAGVLLAVSPPALAKFVADVICVGLTYWLSKRFVFRAPRREESA